MARQKNLDTVIKSERKYIHMVPEYLALRSKGKRTVQLQSGQYAEIDDPGLSILKDCPKSYLTRLYDPANPKDKEVLDALEEALELQPHLATHRDYRVAIIGEFQAAVWPGYDGQSAEELLAYWNAMPDAARPSLEGVMKYELEREDEDGNSLTDPEKVRVLNELYKDAEKAAKAAADDTVSLA